MQLRSQKPERYRIRLTVAVGIATLFGEFLLPFERLGWGNHLPVAAGVLFERGSHARLTGHGLVLLSLESSEPHQAGLSISS